MQEVREEISEETYTEYRNMRYADRAAIIKKDLPLDWVYGYGYYGHRLTTYGGKYYIVHTIGGTCD